MERVFSRKKSDKRYRFSEELRSFAITLQFSSSTAYHFARKTLNLALPHPAQIGKWYRKVPAEPGFMEPAFDALQASVISLTFSLCELYRNTINHRLLLVIELGLGCDSCPVKVPLIKRLVS